MTDSNKPDHDCGCKDINPVNPTPTEKTIRVERDKLCIDLYDAAGFVGMYQEKVKRLKILEKYKHCSFIWSEEYYHFYRELSLKYGSKLIQSSKSIEEGVKKNIESAKKLTDTLRTISKLVGEGILTIRELKESADKLQNSMDDSCNCAAMYIITGKKPTGGCSESKTPIDNDKLCDRGAIKLDELVKGAKDLMKENDALSKSSYEVIGIQAFSIMKNFESLQKNLGTGAKDFDDHIKASIKKGEDAVKKSFDNLGLTAEELSKAKVERYAKRSLFQGLFDSSRNLCCPQCGCIKEKTCSKEICEICKKILPDPVRSTTETQ